MTSTQVPNEAAKSILVRRPKKTPDAQAKKDAPKSEVDSVWMSPTISTGTWPHKEGSSDSNSTLFRSTVNPKVREALQQRIEMPIRLTRRVKERITRLATDGKDVHLKDARDASKDEGADEEPHSVVRHDTYTVFVGNLPPSATKKTLRHLFRACGAIRTVRLRMHQRCPYQRNTNARDPTALQTTIRKMEARNDTNAGETDVTAPKELFGYVCFETMEGWQNAIKQDGACVKDSETGREFVLRVNDVQSDGEFTKKNAVFLGNLPRNVLEQDLFDFLRVDCGLQSLQHVRLIRDPSTGRGRGIGFASFRDSEDTNRALTQVNGKELEGRPVRVTRIQSRQKKQNNSVNPRGGARGSMQDPYASNKKRGRTESASYHPSQAPSERPSWMGTIVTPGAKVQELPRKLRRVLGFPSDENNNTKAAKPSKKRKGNPEQDAATSKPGGRGTSRHVDPKKSKKKSKNFLFA